MLKFISRKFFLALLIIVLSAIALFTKIIDAGSWVAVTSIVCGLYGASNVIHSRFNRVLPEELPEDEGEA